MSYKITIVPMDEPLPARDPRFRYALHYEDREGNRVLMESEAIDFWQPTAQFFRAAIAQVEKRLKGTDVWVRFPVGGEVWEGALTELLHEMSLAEQDTKPAARSILKHCDGLIRADESGR